MKHEPEPSRIRQHGTRVTRATTPEERITAFRNIVERQTYAKVDGFGVDLFSASAVIAVYDKLNQTNQQAFAEWPVQKMIDAAFRILKRQGGA